MGTAEAWAWLNMGTFTATLGSSVTPALSATVTHEYLKVNESLASGGGASVVFTNGTNLADVDVLFIRSDKDVLVTIGGSKACTINLKANGCILIVGTHNSTEWTTISLTNTSGSSLKYTIYAAT